MPDIEYEYGFLWVGGESARPWGNKASGYAQAPHLNLGWLGLDLANIVIPAGFETGSSRTFVVDTTLVPGKWVGAELRLGVTSAPLGGLATVIANGALWITVDWIRDAASDGTFQGYMVFPDAVKYPEVRVLTPYQPEGDGSNAVPYVAGSPMNPPTHILPVGTTHENWGLFLPLTFLEGIASHGVSDVSDSYTVPEAHPCQASSSGDFDVLNTSGGIIENAFAGGYLRVTHEAGTSWARIDTNDGATPNAKFTLIGGWTGDGNPSIGAGFPAESDFIYEAWVPHHDNSPSAYYPGPGFRYPNNESQPSVHGNGEILNLPRRQAIPCYGDWFGAMVEFGWQMAAQLGKRVNILNLACNETTLIPRYSANIEGFKGTLGWWDNLLMSDWALSKTGGLPDRLKLLIETMAPNALLAEGSTKELKILGIVMMMGEEDATSPAGREIYARTMSDFITWLRKTVKEAGLSPYVNSEIPVIHPEISEDPWELSYDTDGLVNAGIREIMAADEFGETFDPDDLGAPKYSFDSSHFTGQGEAMMGELAAIEMASLVNRSLGYGSAIVTDNQQGDLAICNRALALVGQGQKITSLDPTVDETVAADLCARFYFEVRDELIGSHAWDFALRRLALVEAAAKPTTWLYAYVVPPDVLSIIGVMPPESTDDHAITWRPGYGIWESQYGLIMSVGYAMQSMAIEQGAGGTKVIYTNVQNAILRYVSRVVDTTRYSPNFRMALAHKLAAALAGPILKGEAGIATKERMEAIARVYSAEARVQDANQVTRKYDPIVPWIANR